MGKIELENNRKGGTLMHEELGFQKGNWCEEIDVRNFIQLNYVPYEGDESFLTGPSPVTQKLWSKVQELLSQESRNGGVLDVDTHTISTIASHKPGYIDKELEKVVGLQTDEPLKRAIMPFGGMRMVVKGCESYGHEVDPDVVEIFTSYRKTHNEGVYDVYTPEMKRAKKAGIITGLPDAYGRGRIIGDYRRIALYGVDRLITEKQYEMVNLEYDYIDSETIRNREEISEQIKALLLLKEMAKSYGFDISGPARNAREAVQWLYFAYLGVVKEQNGAAMSLGRVSTFLDVYFDKDLREGKITEEEIQELVDQFVMKLRIVRFLRTPDYEKLFSGDPTWVTESIGGMSLDGRTLVTKTSFRILHTLTSLGPAPEPNMTVLWSVHLPPGFKRYCARVSVKTSSIQYESDDIMRHYWGDDYAIACCVSAMRVGKQMQFFGARCNLAKALLYAINGGRDEMTGTQVAPMFSSVDTEYLDYDDVMKRFDMVLDWVARLYMNTLNIIHYMHDKYSYERLQMALHDREVLRTMACGIAGLSVVTDSLSAIKHARVKVIRNEKNIVVDYEVEGDYPKYGNNDERVDSIATFIVKTFMDKLRKQRTYRDSMPTLSVLTITSNVVYGEKTGNTPDGRKTGEPLAPGANPMHGRDIKGALAVLSTIARLPYEYAQDGISYTFSVIPKALGREEEVRINNLVALLDGYFSQGGHHINVNVFEKETLLDAMEHPEKYPQLTIRVSGYAVNFIRLTRAQQLDVINRTIHEHI
jgi:formate C-acetyltransferase